MNFTLLKSLDINKTHLNKFFVTQEKSLDILGYIGLLVIVINAGHYVDKTIFANTNIDQTVPDKNSLCWTILAIPK